MSTPMKAMEALPHRSSGPPAAAAVRNGGCHKSSSCSTSSRSRPAVPLPTRRLVARASSSASVKDMSSRMKNFRSEMEKDDDLGVLMAGLRGKNIDDSDFASEGLEMRLLQVSEESDDRLPLEYDPDQISAYWGIRPVSVISRVLQLLGLSSGFLSRLALDFVRGDLEKNDVARAIDIRNIVTSLGPAYIKLGQALSIRPDLLSPAAMNELQKLCDKVPSFDNDIAMQLLKDELGAPWQEIYAELSPKPIAAASLGQVYKGKLKTGETVAVKVQRPFVLETVTIDLFILRAIGVGINNFMKGQQRTDLVALLDEWAARFFEELDYVHEGENATKFAEQMKDDLPQVKVPKTYSDFTSRRVLTTEWLEGEKLSQSKADDVGTLVNVGVICYLKQLLDTGFFHADPHPGNLIRTPDGRLAILDFGLMTQVDENIKFGMIEAVAHLIRRDYGLIVEDFVTLDFIPPGTDLQPILPVLAKVFDQALEGGGAKNINFQDLAADLAQITFDYPFRIPPYFALIIRAIGVLEGIALVGDPEFAIVDEAYPYISKRLLTDNSPRLQAALRFMVYDGEQFDMDRMLDLLEAFESFAESSRSARGDMDTLVPPSSIPTGNSEASTSSPTPRFPFPGDFPSPFPGGASSFPPSPFPVPSLVGGSFLEAMTGTVPLAEGALTSSGRAVDLGADVNMTASRDALKFMLSGDGAIFREFLLDEAVKAIDAMSRDQLRTLVLSLGLERAMVPVLLPGATKSFVSLAPTLSEEDTVVLSNVEKLLAFLLSRNAGDAASPDPRTTSLLVQELLPMFPEVARELLPELTQRLTSRFGARFIRDVFGIA